MSKRNKHSFPLLDYLDSLVENLRNLVSSAVAGEDVDAVHDARVATRRLKAATLLVDEIVSKARHFGSGHTLSDGSEQVLVAAALRVNAASQVRAPAALRPNSVARRTVEPKNQVAAFGRARVL